MEKQPGARNEELAWSRLSAFTNCVYCLGPVLGGQTVATLRSVVTAQVRSQRVLKLPPVAQGQDMAWLSCALRLLEGAQKLPLGWSRADEPQ